MPNNEFGDFQTPDELATQCLKVLELPRVARVLEPTCGSGSFLKAAAQLAPSSERVGIEIQEHYARRAAEWGDVSIANIFRTRLTQAIRWRSQGPLFVIGNPPWVTSAELNRMDSGNLPPKENFKGAKGLDAILGGANFDVCEYIILKVLEEFRRETLTLGMLCKTQVARNVIEHAAGSQWPLASAAIYRVDAKRWFDAGVDACWFVVRVDPEAPRNYTTVVFDDIFQPSSPRSRFGMVDGRMVADISKYVSVREADGRCPYEWRSGLKHDASKVFELVAAPEPTTQDGERLDLEPEFVFPFLKSTDIFRGKHRHPSKWVIVPQRSFGDDTSFLKYTAPKIWAYLSAHASELDGRKSSIYRNRPRFSVFGHGEYTYAPFKVAVSGLHKEPVFRLVIPLDGKPVVLDDTCYFLPFKDATSALTTTELLNSDACRDLIESLVFWDSKRPLTKKLLSRIDVSRLAYHGAAIIERAARNARSLALDFDAEAANGLLGNHGKNLQPTLF